MKYRLIFFLFIAFALDVHSCVSIEYKFICSEYLSPVVKTFNTFPDTIWYTGVSTKELRADFSFDSTILRNNPKFQFDSSFTKIHQGLRITSRKKTITISGKTAEVGIKSFRLTAINTQDNTQYTTIIAIKIIDKEACRVIVNNYGF